MYKHGGVNGIMNGINVMSLFDGIAAGRLALVRAGIKVYRYYASEIDEYAIKVAKKNWSRYISHIGDVRLVLPDKKRMDRFKGNEIDLMLAGSPCQGFSHAGTLKYFEDERSVLFWEFVRLRDNLKPTWWLLENVPMKLEWRDYISDILGVKPVVINSADFSAQNRRRLYWTNIPIAPWTPVDTKLVDILLGEEFVSPFNLSDKELTYMNRRTKGGRNHWDYKHHSESDKDKSACVVANWRKGVPYNVLMDNRFGKWVRKFHPIEVERLQTFPDKYTCFVSKTRRYGVLGNSWTVDVIAHILKGIKEN